MDLRETPASTVNRHPWELARVAALQALNQTYQILPPGAPILDLGCGDGFIIDTLCQDTTTSIDAVDIHLTAEQLMRFAAARPRLHFHNSYHTLAGKQFAVLTLFDVLEHVDDDELFLRETVSRFAAPGARLFCTAPAFQSLFCYHDHFLKHHRRYNRGTLQKLLTTAGLRVVASGYLFGSLVPTRALAVLAERLMGPSTATPGIGHWRHGQFLTSIITLLLNADNRLLIWLNRMGITIPGLTVWTLCELPR